MKPTLVEDLQFFLHYQFFDFLTERDSFASVSDHDLIKQDYKKLEHVQTGFATSIFPTVLSPTMPLFSLTFQNFGAIVYTFSFLYAVVRCG